MLFTQTFAYSDLATVAVLVVLEGLLSIDNAVVLGTLAHEVDPAERNRALFYGLLGALVFRIIAVLLAAFLLNFPIVKLLGGAYLLYVAIKYFLSKGRDAHASLPRKPRSFWSAVFAIELTDIAFAVDSILAAVALVGPPPPGTAAGSIHPKLWVILTGGMLGVILMRFAAALFTRLLDRFPRLHVSAYILVAIIASKLILDWGVNTPAAPDRLNFRAISSPAFQIFWGAIALVVAAGFVPKKRTRFN